MSAALATNVVAFPGRAMAGLDEDEPGPNLDKFRRQFSDFATVKADEIDETREGWAYYYGDQVPPDVLKAWAKRGQPAIIFPMVDTVADGATGIISEMRGDPKAYPRTPNNEEAAEVSTQCLRSVLDQSDWPTADMEAIRQAYVGGIAVAQLEFVESGDPQTREDDVEVRLVDPRTFYYDPRSVEPDFADARFMGVSKWCTPDDVEEMFPDTGEDIQGEIEGGELTAFDEDRDQLWVQARKRIRLVEHWYKERGEWRVCYYAGSMMLRDDASHFLDERGRSICRFFAFANRVDHKGVHHGFVRRLKGAQDSINQTRSKGQHLMNTRTVKKRKGAGAQTTEDVRKEAARADGVLLFDSDPGEVQIIESTNAFMQNLQFYEMAKQHLERFGPTQPTMGSNGDISGRALAMLMRAGMAQLGPFITNLKDWRLRIYRAVWAQVKNTWTAERMVRITGDQDAPKFLTVNQFARDPYGQVLSGPDGQPIVAANALSRMNVDIIADEGPNTVNVMADVFDLLTTLAQNKVPIPPAAIIELSGLPGSIKAKLVQMLSQPDPSKIATLTAALKNKDADTLAKHAKADHDTALAERERLGGHIDVASAFREAAQPQFAAPVPQPALPGAI